MKHLLSIVTIAAGIVAGALPAMAGWGNGTIDPFALVDQPAVQAELARQERQSPYALTGHATARPAGDEAATRTISVGGNGNRSSITVDDR